MIHFLHNLAYSELYFSGVKIFWLADPSVTYGTIDTVRHFNVMALWLTSCLLILFIRRSSIFLRTVRVIPRGLNIALLVYVFFTLSMLYGNRDLIIGNKLYGQGQALSAGSAFGPLDAILNFRIYFAVYYFVKWKGSLWQLFLVFALEMAASVLIYERKDLLVLAGALSLLYLLDYRNKLSLKHILLVSVAVFAGILMPVYRSFSNDQSLIERVSQSINVITEKWDYFIYMATCFSNTEGVQNWTLQLINSKSLDYLFGLSYLQGFVNIFLLRPFQPEWLLNSQAAYYFKSVAYPHTTNHGYDFSFTSEALLNFGSYFGLISYVILALFIIWVYNTAKHNREFKIILLWPILMIAFRTDSTSMFRMLSYVYFTPLVLRFIYNIISNVRYSRKVFKDR